MAAVATAQKAAVTAKAVKDAMANAVVAVVDAVAVTATVHQEVIAHHVKVETVHHARVVTVHPAKAAIALYVKATAPRVKNAHPVKAKRPVSHAKTAKAAVSAASAVAVDVVTALHAKATAPRAAMHPQPKH